MIDAYPKSSFSGTPSTPLFPPGIDGTKFLENVLNLSCHFGDIRSSKLSKCHSYETVMYVISAKKHVFLYLKKNTLKNIGFL